MIETVATAYDGSAEADKGSEGHGLDPALRLKQVGKSFGTTVAVESLDLVVEPQTFLTILGPSGSGKTTLLRMIGGFIPLSSGSILINEEDVSSLPPGKRGIGMVFQQYALFPHMTVIDNVCYGLKVRKWAKSRQRERGSEVLELVGLSGYEDRLPRQLSGGQQQRVALARALAFEPTMLLMDEPLGALDRELRVRMAGELRRLHDQLGNTVVYVTHDREEALTLSDRIAVMKDGRLEADGSPQDLYGRPPTAFVASFFGGHNLVPCSMPAGQLVSVEGTVEVECLGTRVQAAISDSAVDGVGEYFLAVPGDGFVLGSEGAGAKGVVHSAVYMGNQIQVTCDIAVAGREPVSVRVDLPGGRVLPPAAGEEIWLRVVPELTTLVCSPQIERAATVRAET